MQINENTAVGAFFTDDKNQCPFAPHQNDEFIKQTKRPNEKSVEELRKAMKKGISTRKWKQIDSGATPKFEEVTNQDATKELRPTNTKGEPIRIRIKGTASTKDSNEKDFATFRLSMSAHHLIPGKDSLPKSALASFIWKEIGGLIKGDICYDVDGAENGKWLPTHHVVSSKMAKGDITLHNIENPGEALTWAALSDQTKGTNLLASVSDLFIPRYTQQAMNIAKAQFHDSHSDYSQKVMKMLDQIFVFMIKKAGFCEICKNKAEKDPFPPPHLLVYRLNHLSKSLRTILTLTGGSPNKMWKTFYTSYYALRYYENPLSENNLEG